MKRPDAQLLIACRSLPCQLCGAEDGTVVAAHSNQLRHGKGMGLKAHGYVAALCHSCHHKLDQGKDWTKQERRDYWQLAHERTMDKLSA